jgi:hypothetical protein
LDIFVREPWTPEEDSTILRKYEEIDPKWVTISKILPGRRGNHANLQTDKTNGSVAKSSQNQEEKLWN